MPEPRMRTTTIKHFEQDITLVLEKPCTERTAKRKALEAFREQLAQHGYICTQRDVMFANRPVKLDDAGQHWQIICELNLLGRVATEPDPYGNYIIIKRRNVAEPDQPWSEIAGIMREGPGETQDERDRNAVGMAMFALCGGLIAEVQWAWHPYPTLALTYSRDEDLRRYRGPFVRFLF